MSKKKSKFNHRARKKMRRKILRKDRDWEDVLAALTMYEINTTRKENK